MAAIHCGRARCRSGEFRSQDSAAYPAVPAHRESVESRCYPAAVRRAAEEAERRRVLRERMAETDRKGRYAELPQTEREWIEADPRRKELAFDPDKGRYKVDEAKTALAAEEAGFVPSPVRRALQHNRAVLNRLPADDDWPFLTRSMFSTAGAAPERGRYRSQVVHVGASMKRVECEWHEWLPKFEALLARLYFRQRRRPPADRLRRRVRVPLDRTQRGSGNDRCAHRRRARRPAGAVAGAADALAVRRRTTSVRVRMTRSPARPSPRRRASGPGALWKFNARRNLRALCSTS